MNTLGRNIKEMINNHLTLMGLSVRTKKYNINVFWSNLDSEEAFKTRDKVERLIGVKDGCEYRGYIINYYPRIFM